MRKEGAETDDGRGKTDERKGEDEEEEDSRSNLLELTGRLGTRMKCFQREVEATDERIAKTKKLSSMSQRSPKRKKKR